MKLPLEGLIEQEWLAVAFSWIIQFMFLAWAAAALFAMFWFFGMIIWWFIEEFIQERTQR